MKIVGLFMVKNEDVYIEQAVRNVAEFCDIIYVDDNGSSDNTPAILNRLEAEFDHIHVRKITDTIESNEMLVPYFGTDTWIFAVDGDELYDRQGLVEMRKHLESGEFDDWWLILGNCLHVVKIDDQHNATGYLAPPSSSMTKLYNFSLIDDFPISDERLHGTPVFKDGEQMLSRRYELWKLHGWEDSFFRCVHTAFVQRTSMPKEQKRIFGIRVNPAQIYTLKKIWRDHSFFYAFPRSTKLIIEILLGIDSRQKRYKSGPKVVKPVASFFSK